jgi:hypothetical protein
LVFTANHHQWVVPHFLLLVLKTLSSFVAACFIWPQKMRDVKCVKTLLSPNRYWLENCLFWALTIIMPPECKLWCTHSSAWSFSFTPGTYRYWLHKGFTTETNLHSSK